jgi:long-chain fatty acid transport protein
MRLKLFAALAALTVPLAAQATDGYFSHGWGMKAKGRAGIAIAMTDDAYGGVNNPGTMVWAGRRFDVGLDWFSPEREASRTGTSAFGPFSIDGSAQSGSTSFFVPEFAYNHPLSSTLSLGISVIGQGGMNTDYPGGQLPAGGACAGFNPTPGPYNLLCGNGDLGVDLAQLVIAPTLSWKFHPQHSVGVAPLIGYQRFKADGLQAFDNPMFSASPGNVTNRGHDDAWGWGVRIGYYGQITPQVGIGATYASKIYMSEFDKYKGLFAENGDFDVPENFGVGVAFRPIPSLLIGVDYKRINYNDVPSVGNPSANILGAAAGNAANRLGGPAGAGFGWQNVDVWKIGIDYQWSQALTLRAGYGHSDNPIRPQDVTFNILAPGVVQDHLTLGLTYAFGKQHEITAEYMHAFEESVSGQSLFVPLSGGLFPANTTETVKLYENSFGMAYSYKF